MKADIMFCVIRLFYFKIAQIFLVNFTFLTQEVECPQTQGVSLWVVSVNDLWCGSTLLHFLQPGVEESTQVPVFQEGERK